MKLQSPDIEPAPALPRSSPAREPQAEGARGVSSTPSPPPVPSAVAAPSELPAPPPAASATPAASSSSVPAGYAAPTGQSDFLSWPSLERTTKTIPSAQFPPPLFPSSYGVTTPPPFQVLPAPQSACVACTTQTTKKCCWKPGKCKLLLMRKLECLKRFIHEHCPFKKKASKACCQNCPCCGPLYVGAMPSAQWISTPLQSAPVLVPSNANPATPQASRSSSSVDQERAEERTEALTTLEPLAGTKPSDVSQGWEDLKPVASEGLNKAP
jgi:hypothetical protein